MELVFRHPEAGEMVGDYRIVKRIGSGGFGTVFQAERAGLLFSVKLLHSPELGARARCEIGILLQLDHPGVARFRACDRWLDPKLGTPYIVTDFVPGLTLKELAQEGNLSARESARIVLETALTLGDIHRQGVFHRDLKPENIILPGRNERPVLIDFGVGTYAGAPVMTPFGLPPGTPEFRAPEAYLFLREDMGLAHYEFGTSDEFWALGVTFYWLLTRVLPFCERSDPEGGGLTERILHQTPVAPHVRDPSVPRAFSDICMKMLEKKPEDRYASGAELCAALRGARVNAPDTWTTEEAAPPATAAPLPPLSRHRSRLVTAAGLVVGVLGVLAPLPTSPDPTPTQQANPGHEMALCMQPLDPPVMTTMLPTDDISEKSQQKQTKVLGRARKTLGTAFVCTTLAGCSAPQVRSTPEPDPAPCPAGAVETMKTLGINVGNQCIAIFLTPDTDFFIVQEGDTTLDMIVKCGKLPGRTLLFGRLIFGAERVYGRLTEAKVPGGETFKVCMEVWDEEGGRGAIREGDDGGRERARIFSTVRVRAVSSFE